jgi:hypothetical protein
MPWGRVACRRRRGRADRRTARRAVRH